MGVRKRFIAGAVCPECQSQDSIFVTKEEKAEIVRCAACEYIEQRDENKEAQSASTHGNVIGLFKPE